MAGNDSLDVKQCSRFLDMRCCRRLGLPTKRQSPVLAQPQVTSGAIPMTEMTAYPAMLPKESNPACKSETPM